MKNKYLLLLIVALIALSNTSCESRLDIPQKGVLDYSFYYQTDEHAEAASNALYIQLKGTYYDYTMLKNALSCSVVAVVVAFFPVELQAGQSPQTLTATYKTQTWVCWLSLLWLSAQAFYLPLQRAHA